MKKLKYLLVATIVMCAIHSTVHGQATKFPKASDLNNPEDYPKYKSKVVECINWFEDAPMDSTNMAQRTEVRAFILKWITGTNDVKIVMGPTVMEHTKANPDLVVAFLGGWVKYSLANPNEKDVVKLNTIGAEEMVKVYKANKGIKKDEMMDKMVDLKEKNRLQNYFSQQPELKGR